MSRFAGTAGGREQRGTGAQGRDEHLVHPGTVEVEDLEVEALLREGFAFLGFAAEAVGRVFGERGPVTAVLGREAQPVQQGLQRLQRHGAGYIPWQRLMQKLGIDVETCPRCAGKMKVIALVQDPQGIARYLRHLGLPTEEPSMAPARGPPFWLSRVLRRRYGETADAAQA